jgi:hypothetical protein
MKLFARDTDVGARRDYYWGRQYDELNQHTADVLGVSDPSGLKEHQRAHAYSTHTQEGLDFLADQITGGMVIKSEAADDAERAKISQFIDDLWDVSQMEDRNQEISREVLMIGNLYGELVPRRLATVIDPANIGVEVRWWEEEAAEFIYSSQDWKQLVKVIIQTVDWDDEEIVREYTMRPFLYPDDEVRLEAVEDTYEADTYGSDDQVLVGTRRLGLPFLPFIHLRGEAEGLRSMFGRSAIQEQLMRTVDRYNATRQLEYLALRYNSFATLAVVGDQIHLKAESGEDLFIRKDIGDFASFPGGTGIHSIELPTDTGLITDQLEGLADAIWSLLGLEDIDPSKISSFGGVSGYALEILNRKTDGTFRKTVEALKHGFRRMILMAMDVDGYARFSSQVEQTIEGEAGTELVWDFYSPEVVAAVEGQFEDRNLRVSFGTAYIVDEVAVRDDFVSEMISRQEALRKKGYSEDEIAKIVEEIDSAIESTGAAIEQGTRFSTVRS